MDVRTAFGAGAADYDRTRRLLIPCFDDFYGIAVGLAPFAPDDSLRVLDLGAGTGLMSACFAAAFPRARFTLVDVAPEMLERARERFAGQDGRFAYAVADYAHALPEGRFDLIVSALSIHHLSDADKRTLFARAHDALEAGGAFINADEVLGETPAVEERQVRMWVEEVRRRGASEADVAAARERMRLDRCATLEEQVRWLAEAGFRDAACSFRYHMFAVYSGSR